MLVTNIFSFSHNVFQMASFQGCLTLSHMTKFRLFQIKRVCRQWFQIWWTWQNFLLRVRKHWPIGKFFVASNFSFSHSVFKRLILQTSENQGLFGKEFKSELCGKELDPLFTDKCFVLFQTSFRSYPWLLLGIPVLFVVHGFVAFITWFFVVTIPIAKVRFTVKLW